MVMRYGLHKKKKSLEYIEWTIKNKTEKVQLRLFCRLCMMEKHIITIYLNFKKK